MPYPASASVEPKPWVQRWFPMESSLATKMSKFPLLVRAFIGSAEKFKSSLSHLRPVALRPGLLPPPDSLPVGQMCG